MKGERREYTVPLTETGLAPSIGILLYDIFVRNIFFVFSLPLIAAGLASDRMEHFIISKVLLSTAVFLWIFYSAVFFDELGHLLYSRKNSKNGPEAFGFGFSFLTWKCIKLQFFVYGYSISKKRYFHLSGFFFRLVYLMILALPVFLTHTVLLRIPYIAVFFTFIFESIFYRLSDLRRGIGGSAPERG